MNRILLSFALILFSLSASANYTVSESDAQKYANNFMSIYSKNELSEAQITHFNGTSSKTVVAYIINYYPEGWIIISADKRVVPVLAYSKEGEFVIEGLDALPFYFWFEQYQKEIEWIKSSKISQIHPDWTSLKTPIKSSAVEPLIKAKWNQNQGWNQFCPEDAAGPGGRVYAGCVAVAMGQAMSVYKHPNKGVGSKNFYSPFGTLTANFGETQYKWNLMSNTQANEHSALLLYHLGISVDMGYSASGSGAFSASVPGALKTYFDYSKDVKIVAKNNYSDEAWQSLMANELLAGRPVYYSGNSGTGQAGHAFNLDGTDGGGRFHFNWGWSGSYDGYYFLSSLTPGNNIFTVSQQAVINISLRNHNPTDLFLSNNIIDEGLPAGSVVGTITVEDDTPNDSHTFTVRGQENIFGFISPVPFDIENNKLITTEKLDFKITKSYNIVIEVVDMQGNVFEKPFEIKVKEVIVETSAAVIDHNDLELFYLNSYLHICFTSSYIGPYSVLLTDMSGRIIFKNMFNKELSTEHNRIAISNIRPGIYIFSIHNAGTTISRRIYLY
jgi:hypothetical protein